MVGDYIKELAPAATSKAMFSILDNFELYDSVTFVHNEDNENCGFSFCPDSPCESC